MIPRQHLQLNPLTPDPEIVGHAPGDFPCEVQRLVPSSELPQDLNPFGADVRSSIDLGARLLEEGQGLVGSAQFEEGLAQPKDGALAEGLFRQRTPEEGFGIQQFPGMSCLLAELLPGFGVVRCGFENSDQRLSARLVPPEEALDAGCLHARLRQRRPKLGGALEGSQRRFQLARANMRVADTEPRRQFGAVMLEDRLAGGDSPGKIPLIAEVGRNLQLRRWVTWVRLRSGTEMRKRRRTVATAARAMAESQQGLELLRLLRQDRPVARLGLGELGQFAQFGREFQALPDVGQRRFRGRKEMLKCCRAVAAPTCAMPQAEQGLRLSGLQAQGRPVRRLCFADAAKVTQFGANLQKRGNFGRVRLRGGTEMRQSHRAVATAPRAMALAQQGMELLGLLRQNGPVTRFGFLELAEFAEFGREFQAAPDIGRRRGRGRPEMHQRRGVIAATARAMAQTEQRLDLAVLLRKNRPVPRLRFPEPAKLTQLGGNLQERSDFVRVRLRSFTEMSQRRRAVATAARAMAEAQQGMEQLRLLRKHRLVARLRLLELAQLAQFGSEFQPPPDIGQRRFGSRLKMRQRRCRVAATARAMAQTQERLDLAGLLRKNRPVPCLRFPDPAKFTQLGRNLQKRRNIARTRSRSGTKMRQRRAMLATPARGLAKRERVGLGQDG